ncbi:MAG: DNA alkylation repair protein [Deltaproteobacteria bacterium]|nr:DNA alkylation repair protein [Deltaproteobacteria bacterium]
MSNVQEVIEKLKARAKPENVEGMVKFGMTGDKRLGVSVPELRKLAREIGRDHMLALELWKTGIPEAKIVAGMVGDPERLTERQMESWVKGFDSWDVCDQVCMNLFEKSPLVMKKIHDWSEREEEFVKRAAYALIACLAWHDKEAKDEVFIELLPLIKRGATDGRNFVKKAVDWALRSIGKRNPSLNRAAIKTAGEIQGVDSKSSRWIASSTLRELTSEAVQERLKRNR